MTINLRLEFSSNGKLEDIKCEPVTDEKNLTSKQLVIDQRCPCCSEAITLNVFTTEVKETHLPEWTIKEEVIGIENLNVEVKCDTEIVDDDHDVPSGGDYSEEEADLKSKRARKKKPQCEPAEECECLNCGKVCAKRKALYQHQRKCLADAVVCYQCDDRKKFSRMVDFFLHAKKEHDSKLQCHICDPPKFFDSGKQWSPHMRIHKRKKEGYECDKCHKRFLLKLNYQAHVDDYFKGDMCCRLCEDRQIFTHRSAFCEHLKKVHNCYNFPCPFCDGLKDFDTEAKLQQHMSQVHWANKRFWCLFCKERFETLEEKHAHPKSCSQRAPESHISCSLCEKKFARKHSLLYHMRTTHRLPQATYVCHLCGETFPNNSHYQFHLQNHELGPRPYECHHCGRKFQAKKTIAFHILRFHYPRDLCTIRCDQCDDRFATQELLNRHMVQHKEKIRCKCDICGKILVTKSALVQHKKRQHTIEGQSMKFRCDQCDFTTTKDFYLKKHKITHLSDAEKPYQCRFCGKGFLNKNIGTRHEWAHTDTRPYTCDVCGKNFRHHTDLKSHRRLHTGERPYQVRIINIRKILPLLLNLQL